MVIPIMDHLDQHLATSAIKLSLPASICAAASLGKHSLNKYYTMTDQMEVYWIAMGKSSLSLYLPCFNSLCLVVLHPCHKLDYFKTARWDDKWIETARNIVRVRVTTRSEVEGVVGRSNLNREQLSTVELAGCPKRINNQTK